MDEKLMGKSDFARLAQVAPASVTKALSSSLRAALSGRMIDASHPDAQRYVAKHTLHKTLESTPSTPDQIQEAEAFFITRKSYSVKGLQDSLGITQSEAARITGSIQRKYNYALPTVATYEPEDLQYARGWNAKKEAQKNTVPLSEIIEMPASITAFADMPLRDLIEKFGTDVRFVDWLNATQKIESINEKRLKNAVIEGDLVNRDLVKTGIIDPINAAHLKLLTDGAKTITLRATAMYSAKRDIKDIEKFVSDQISSFIRPMKSKIARALKNA